MEERQLPPMENEYFRNPIPQADPQWEVSRLNVVLAVGLLFIYVALALAGLVWLVSK